MEEGKGERYLAPGHQYGNALLGVRHQEESQRVQSARRNISQSLQSEFCRKSYSSPEIPLESHCLYNSKFCGED